ncbi:DUF1543 domain-containing protein [Mucilaginibacter gotjawali]|uniref:DUF1543 domain-containing protein n=2 Tax=Mucilaginibacter gotjawali TaxID=1550579 RepID=A0A839SDB4_9SPHI|nr:DUF1543 domain-containing protein [Mucilaginibacter gotjawali]MBB3054870.1 hypothetical protein [Mucilaginibacter gotjawali]
MMNMPSSAELKLFMVLLGSKSPARNVEQHDYFFGIGQVLNDLVPQMRAFWPGTGNSLHVDGWREVTRVSGFRVEVVLKERDDFLALNRLFFINLGGYQADKLEEQHYTVLSVHSDRAQAARHAKQTLFYKTNTLKGAGSHIDEKYGIDVDDIYHIEEILPPGEKEKYRVLLTPAEDVATDKIHLGYLKLDKIK